MAGARGATPRPRVETRFCLYSTSRSRGPPAPTSRPPHSPTLTGPTPPTGLPGRPRVVPKAPNLPPGSQVSRALACPTGASCRVPPAPSPALAAGRGSRVPPSLRAWPPASRSDRKPPSPSLPRPLQSGPPASLTRSLRNVHRTPARAELRPEGQPLPHGPCGLAEETESLVSLRNRKAELRCSVGVGCRAGWGVWLERGLTRSAGTGSCGHRQATRRAPCDSWYT